MTRHCTSHACSSALTAVSSDGSASQIVTVTINGTNDTAVIGGVATGSVTEDLGVVAGNIATSGALTISDADQGQANLTRKGSTVNSSDKSTFTPNAAGN